MNANDWDKYDVEVDPCPTCGAAVEGYDSKPEYIRSNRESIVSIRNPACPHETDPEADCTCTVVLNPAPNPTFDKMTKVFDHVTLQPCGDRFQAWSQLTDAGWKVTSTVKPGWHARKIEALREEAARLGIDLPS